MADIPLQVQGERVPLIRNGANRISIDEIICAMQVPKSDDVPGVYAIFNRINGRCYIGSTKRPIKNRIIDHFRRLKRGAHTNNKLQADWSEGNLDYVVLDNSNDDTFSIEQSWIDKIEPYYNLSAIADSRKFFLEINSRSIGLPRKPVSDETRAKLSMALTGKKRTDEQKNRISIAKKGKTHAISDQQKEALSIRCRAMAKMASQKRWSDPAQKIALSQRNAGNTYRADYSKKHE